MVDASTAANYGFSPVEVARGKMEASDHTDEPDHERAARLKRVHDHCLATNGILSHGYR
jgi:hypothetical protein